MDPAAFVKQYYEIFDKDRARLVLFYVRRFPNFPSFKTRPLSHGDGY